MDFKSSNLYTIERHIEDPDKPGDTEIVPSNVVCFNQAEVDALTEILIKRDTELFEVRYAFCGVEVVRQDEYGESSLTLNNLAVKITIYYKVVNLQTLEG